MIVNLTALLLLAIYARYRWLSHLKERDFWRWYDIYLKTAHWKRYRRLRLLSVGYRCKVCGNKYLGNGDHLQVHHLRYDRLWFERLWDTDVLCSYHHRQAHEKKAKQVIQAKRRNSK